MMLAGMTLAEKLGEMTNVPWPIWASLFAITLILVSGALVRSRLAAADGGIVPDSGYSVRNIIELLTEMLVGMAEQTMGHKWRSYFPFVATLFIFILFANLLGLIPGLGGATTNANVTWAWALISFAVHQYVGVKENGVGYLKHFVGPVPLLAPLYIPIELISHFSRVFTLAVRLLANMSADHIVVGVWLALVPVAIPAVFLGLGVVVAFLQAYVFAMLSMIYIGLALHHDDDSH
jgi:F-type H+-transporting ATPase subunit a